MSTAAATNSQTQIASPLDPSQPPPTKPFNSRSVEKNMAAAQSNRRLQVMLQTAVQAVRWTYSLFWHFSPQGVLVWDDGYYNGPIKTRKTVQPMEVSPEEASLHRSQQLRELYESLSAGESNQLARRPSAALAPEDLTESEWFYLMCVSFSFSPGAGLPGKAYSRKQHVWLAGANEVDSKVFSRAILAKSARIQTVVCIPLQNGVVELGTTDLVEEDVGFIQQVKGYFSDVGLLVNTSPRPAHSGHSTSNPSSSAHILQVTAPVDDSKEDDDDDDDDDGDDEENQEVVNFDSEGRHCSDVLGISEPNVEGNGVEQIELMQLEMSEDIRLGSPDDGSNNLDSEFRPLFASQSQGGPYCGVDAFNAESSRHWEHVMDPSSIVALQSAHSGDEDTHYSQTVSTILNHQSTHLSYTTAGDLHTLYYSPTTSFSKWTSLSPALPPAEDASQLLLKCILFTVPYLHAKSDDLPCSRLRKGTPHDDLSANHVLAERRRREKLNERFVILRSLVPCVTKMDKASILGDTIEYLKQLRRRIQELEARTGEPDTRPNRVGGKNRRSAPRGVETQLPPNSVEVSIIESDALLELHCPYRENLLLDIMQTLRELRVETTSIQSSLNNGVLIAELRAKVKENLSGKRASIMEAKRAINQLLPHGV